MARAICADFRFICKGGDFVHTRYILDHFNQIQAYDKIIDFLLYKPHRSTKYEFFLQFWLKGRQVHILGILARAYSA